MNARLFHELRQSPLFIFWIGLILILALALRLTDLTQRPVHVDEATGAYIMAERLAGEYAFDPTHFHGPVLSMLTVPAARLSGQKSWKEIEIQTLRLVPVFFSMLTVLLPLLLIPYAGVTQSLISCAFLATSPLLVYYSRMYIHETLLGFFVLGGLICLKAWFHKPTRGLSVAFGIFAGLMAGTKETAAITLIAWTLSAGILLIGFLFRNPESRKELNLRKYIPDLLLAAASAGMVIVILYTDFFRQPSAILGFIQTYLHYETMPGHDKGFWQYAYWLVHPKFTLGSLWTEGALLLCALVGTAGSFVTGREIFGRFLRLSLLIHWLIYSWIDYKVPWLMLVPWIHLCLLSGIGAQFIIQRFPRWRILAWLTVGSLISFQGIQAYRAAIRFPSDARNPYAYSPTTRDTERIQVWLKELIHLHEQKTQEDLILAVIGNHYWPLPWYLKNFSQTGYWNEMPANADSFPLVLVMQSHNENLPAEWSDGYHAFPFGLRYEYLMYLYIRRDLWEHYLASENAAHE